MSDLPGHVQRMVVSDPVDADDTSSDTADRAETVKPWSSQPATKGELDELLAEVEQIIDDALSRYDSGFEQRLAASFQKVLDTVMAEYDERVRELEEDQARILRHLGLSSGEDLD